MQRLVSHTLMSNQRGYVVNLDPAVMTLPFGANIDIRDTVRYKEVMKEFNLGPNGGILTSLNLFATKFDEVKLISQSSPNFALVNLHVSLYSGYTASIDTGTSVFTAYFLGCIKKDDI